MDESHEEAIETIDNGKRLLVQRDNLATLNELIKCLNFVVTNPEYKLYSEQPHHSLVLQIESLIAEIDDEVAEVIGRLSLGY